MVKIVTFFLIGMAILALLGRLRLPKISRNRDTGGLPKPRLCPDCGRYSLRGERCRDCSKGPR